MKTLVLYGTKHGCTEKCARQLAERLDGDITTHNIKDGEIKDLNVYDKIIIGGSIYAGMINKKIKKFCSNNHELLKGKKTGYFICGMRDGAEATDQLTTAFGEDLLTKAVVKESFGGEVILDRMGYFEKVILKKVAKIEKDYNNLLEDKIQQFAKEMNQA